MPPNTPDSTPPVDVGAGARAGLVAGTVFLVVEMIVVPLALGGSMWRLLRMMAGIAMGSEVVAPPETFDPLIVLVALVVHFALSAFYGMVLALFIRGMSAGTALVAGAGFGVALYAINFYGFTLLFPWFATARTWVTLVTHIVFGLVAAGVYKARPGRVRPLLLA
jgi:hypothetical protein